MSAWFSVEYCWCSVDMRTYCAARMMSSAMLGWLRSNVRCGRAADPARRPILATPGLRPRSVGSRLHEPHARFDVMDRGGKPGERVRARGARRCEHFDERPARHLEARCACSARDDVVGVLGQQENDLARRCREALPPAARSSGWHPREANAGRPTHDRSRDRRPPAPQVPRKQRGEDAPRRPTGSARADVTQHRRPLGQRLAEEPAVDPTVDVYAGVAAARAGSGAVAVAVVDAPLVLGEVDDLGHDDRAAPEATAAREDEAAVG